MKFLGWTIEQNKDDSLPNSYLLAACLTALVIAYLTGYLFIDVLSWLKLSPEQMQGGFPFVARVLIGCMVFGIPLAAYAEWDSNYNEHYREKDF